MSGAKKARSEERAKPKIDVLRRYVLRATATPARQ
jgi:hypothetical protein